MPSIPVALNCIPARPHEDGFAGTVAEVAKIGYTGVETAGYGNLDVNGVAAALKDNGLTCAGMHVGIDALRANLNRCVSDALLLGAKHVTCPGWPRDHYHSGAACTRIGEELGAIGATFRAHGIQFAFHNHSSELAVVDGRRVFDWMLDAAAPRDLACQADVYWVQVGGKDPAAFIREQGRRIRTLHLKDEKEIGGGQSTSPGLSAPPVSIAPSSVHRRGRAVQFRPARILPSFFQQLRTWGRLTESPPMPKKTPSKSPSSAPAPSASITSPRSSSTRPPRSWRWRKPPRPADARPPTNSASPSSSPITASSCAAPTSTWSRSRYPTTCMPRSPSPPCAPAST